MRSTWFGMAAGQQVHTRPHAMRQDKVAVVLRTNL